MAGDLIIINGLSQQRIQALKILKFDFTISPKAFHRQDEPIPGTEEVFPGWQGGDDVRMTTALTGGSNGFGLRKNVPPHKYLDFVSSQVNIDAINEVVRAGEFPLTLGYCPGLIHTYPGASIVNLAQPRTTESSALAFQELIRNQRVVLEFYFLDGSRVE